LHKWAAQLVTDQTQQNLLAQRRLQDKEARKIKKANNERKEKTKGILSRAAFKRIEMEYKRNKPKLPRDLAGVQNTVAFRYAPKQLRPAIIPTRPRRTRTKAGGVDMEKAKKFAFDTLGVHLRAATSDASPTNTPSLAVAYPNQRIHFDRTKTVARKRADWAMDNERLPLILEKAIYERNYNEANFPPKNLTPKKAPKKAQKRAPQKAPSPLRAPSASSACPSASSIIKQYTHYTHHNVTGDGRCYFYVILRALGMKLTREKGAVANLERFFKNNHYLINPRYKRKLQRQVRNGTCGDPENVIDSSLAIRRLLYDRNIRYIATIQQTRTKPNIVDDYIRAPKDVLTSPNLISLSQLHADFTLQSFTQQQRVKTTLPDTLIKAIQNKTVITFVHQNYPSRSEHYSVILPR
jgi:hypothetical protein